MLIKSLIKNLDAHDLTSTQMQAMVDELQKNTLLRYLGEFGFLPETFKKNMAIYLEEQMRLDHNNTTDVHDRIFMNKRGIITAELGKIFKTNLLSLSDIIAEIITFTNDDEMIEYLSFINEELQGGDTEYQIKLSLQYYLEKIETHEDVLNPLKDGMTAVMRGEIYPGKTYSCMPGLAERLIDRVGALMDSQKDDRHDAVYLDYAQLLLQYYSSGEGKLALMTALWYALDLPELNWVLKPVEKKMLHFNNQSIGNLSKDAYKSAEETLLEIFKEDANPINTTKNQYDPDYFETYSREFLERHQVPVDMVSKNFTEGSHFCYKDSIVNVATPENTDIDDIISDAHTKFGENDKEHLYNSISKYLKIDISQLRCILLGFRDGLSGLFEEMCEVQYAEKTVKILPEAILSEKAQSHYTEREIKSKNVYDEWQQNSENTRLYLLETLPTDSEILDMKYISEDTVIKFIQCNEISSYVNDLLLVASHRYAGVVESLLLLKHEKTDVNFGGTSGNTALMIACSLGHDEIVDRLLEENDLDVNKVNSSGRTALMFAAYKGHTEIVELLLAHEKIAVNVKDNSDETALMYAANHGYIEIVSKLIENKFINVNLTSKYLWTALMLAAGKGHLEIVEMLLAHEEIDVNLENNNRDTALTIAVQQGHSEIVSQLIDHNGIGLNVVNNVDNSALIYAVMFGHQDIIIKLLEHEDINVNIIGKFCLSALMLAADKGHLEIVEMLLAHEKIAVNLKNEFGDTALIIAVQQGYCEIVSKLIEHNDTDLNVLNERGETVLMIAALEGRTKIAELLLAHKKIDVNVKDYRGNTALTIAVKQGHSEIASQLIDHNGTDKNVVTDYDYSALTIAVEQGNYEIVSKLIEHNDIDLNDRKHPPTALMVAAYKGHAEIAALLLAKEKIDINLKHMSDDTALTIAVQQGHSEIVSQLINHNDIDLNVVNKNDETALMIASRMGHFKIADLLLASNKIDVNLKNTCGNTALTYAVDGNRFQFFCDLLKHNGININVKNNHGDTALMMAAEIGYKFVVSKLLDRPDIEVNAKSGCHGTTALMYAAKSNYFEILSKLLEHGNIDVNVKDNYGDTALMYAVKFDNRFMVEELLQQPEIECSLAQGLYSFIWFNCDTAGLLLNHWFVSTYDWLSKKIQGAVFPTKSILGYCWEAITSLSDWFKQKFNLLYNLFFSNNVSTAGSEIVYTTQTDEYGIRSLVTTSLGDYKLNGSINKINVTKAYHDIGEIVFSNDNMNYSFIENVSYDEKKTVLSLLLRTLDAHTSSHMPTIYQYTTIKVNDVDDRDADLLQSLQFTRSGRQEFVKSVHPNFFLRFCSDLISGFPSKYFGYNVSNNATESEHKPSSEFGGTGNISIPQETESSDRKDDYGKSNAAENVACNTR